MKLFLALCVFYWVERKSSSALVSWCVEPDLILRNAGGVTKLKGLYKTFRLL